MMLSLIPDIFLIVCLLMLQSQAFITREIIVTEPVTFPCTCSGNCPVVQWMRFIPSEVVIAKISTCQSEQHCQKRFAVSGDTNRGDFSLTIGSVFYNDIGSYRCTCNGTSVTEVKLKILVPTVVKAFKGENVTLPCYGDTRNDVKDVKWKKAGQKVLLYSTANRSVTTSEPRFSLSEDFLHGDLSLHISSVHQCDAGLYQCLIHDESQEGEPKAVLLEVEGRQPSTGTSSNAVSVVCALLGLILLVGII
ncbi:uncharacterized protein LOC128508300 [Clarias gariepinus]|uniref:uncharacterized protein LOC128508300 n=1 Tax=Clarias gariepinus TaxID=13013 RepID=UPI00234D6534|nr:uncharacterized protein LOC128508300 [Clarias gariepinus]